MSLSIFSLSVLTFGASMRRFRTNHCHCPHVEDWRNSLLRQAHAAAVYLMYCILLFFVLAPHICDFFSDLTCRPFHAITSLKQFLRCPHLFTVVVYLRRRYLHSVLEVQVPSRTSRGRLASAYVYLYVGYSLTRTLHLAHYVYTIQNSLAHPPP